MKTILVGTDFSPRSDKAFAKACELAQTLGATIHLLHVLEPVDEPGSSDPETQEFYAKLEEGSKTKMASLIRLADVTVHLTSSVRIGHRHQLIVEIAEEIQAEMIVLGSHPLTEEAARIGPGHRVAVTARRPVLLVP